MTWVAVAGTAVSVVSSVAAGGASRANTAAQNRVSKAETIAANLMRGANNELLSKRNALARYVQNENNSRVMKQTGREQEADLVNYRRARDAATAGDFEAQIGFAEQAGAQVAMAGASGLTGGIADIVGSTTALRISRIKQATLQATGQADWDATRRQADILSAGLNSLDQSFIVDDLDYSLNVHSDQAPKSSVFGDVLNGVLANPGGIQAAGKFFNTPNYSAFADRAGAIGSGSDGRSRTITGGR